MKNKKKYLLISSILFSLFSIGFITSYAFFNFSGSTNVIKYTNGMIDLTLTNATSTNLEIDKAFPMEYSEVVSANLSTIDFTLSGINESSNIIYYDLKIVDGEDVTGKTRIDPKYISFDLYDDDGNYYFKNARYDEFKDKEIYVNKIDSGSSLNSTVFHFRAWINEKLIIGNTSNAEYTSSEWENIFATVKITANGDFNKRENTYSYLKKAEDTKEDIFGLSPLSTKGTKGTTYTACGNMSTNAHHCKTGMTSINKQYLDTYTPDSILVNYFFPDNDFFKAKALKTTEINFNKVSESEYNSLITELGTEYYDHSDSTMSYVKTIGYFEEIGTDEYSYNLVSTGLIMFPEDSSNFFELVANDSSIEGDTVFTWDDIYLDTDPTTSYLDNIEYIHLNNTYTGNVTNFNYLLMNKTKLKEFNLSEWDTHNATSISGMFLWCKALETLDLNYLDTSQVVYMDWTFAGLNLDISEDGNTNDFCGGLEKLDVHNVQYIDNLFSNCPNIIRLDLSNWYTGKLEYLGTGISGELYYSTDIKNQSSTKLETYGAGYFLMSYIHDCNLTYLDVSNFDVSNITSGYLLFYGFNKLKTLNIKNWDTSSMTTMYGMFWNCTNLTNLDVSNFDTSNVTTMRLMFSTCKNLTEIDVSNFNTEKCTSFENMFSTCSKITSLDLRKWDTSSGKSFQYMFSYCSLLSNIKFKKITTDTYGIMGSMFSSCTSLTSLDLSGFDTSKVTQFGSMFSGCTGLTTLDLSNFDVSSGQSFNGMFMNCSNLTTLNISSFVTTSATDMNCMFHSCSKLTTIDVSNFDVSLVTNMSMMFYNCSNLTSLDLSGFVTTSVTDIQQMFYNCQKLGNLNLSNFNTSNVTSMYQLFYDCYGMTEIDLTSFDFTNVEEYRYMFACQSKDSKLEHVYMNNTYTGYVITGSETDEELEILEYNFCDMVKNRQNIHNHYLIPTIIFEERLVIDDGTNKGYFEIKSTT